jgi:hypothetical protein
MKVDAAEVIPLIESWSGDTPWLGSITDDCPAFIRPI